MALTQIDGATFPPGQLKDRIESELWGFDGTNWRRVAVTAGGNFVVSSGAVAPGVVITSPADTALPAGVVPLPVPPVGTTRMTVQVTAGDAATRVRVRELGGLAGAGVLLTLLASRVYGSDGGSVEPLEVELVAGAAAAIAIQFEG